MPALSPLCPHFGVCGGCATQDQPYEIQLAAKEALVRRVVEPFHPRQVLAIQPSPDVLYYRNKMEFAFARHRSGGVAIGLREKGRFDRVVDVRECFLLSPETPRLLAAVRAWAEAESLEPYDLKSHRGFLRYLVVREGKNTGQRMVRLVTAGRAGPVEDLPAVLAAAGFSVDTAVWTIHEGVSDVARGAFNQNLSGAGAIDEKLGERVFRISPDTFFQTNTRGAEVLCAVIREFLGSSVETLMDIYCGSGSMALACADLARRVVGVEVDPRSVEDARANAGRQGAAHASFFALDAAALPAHPGLSALWKKPGTAAILDPPRPGLPPSVKQLLRSHPVERWVYVSCNPKALAVDLPLLMEAYRIDAVQPVDLFPHTPHVEAVLLLRRK
jgi:23S rRNA (uracil1939-C5)-methyltransferase